MNYFIAKNGQQHGPYTLEEIQRLVAAGTVHATDLAWYEGLADWIPINHLPGFSSSTPNAVPYAGGGYPPPAPHRRPILVWVISIFYFICTPLALLSLAIIPIALSGAIPVSDAQRSYFESLNAFDYAVSVLGIVLNLAGAIYLFLLRRAALYLLAGNLLLGMVNLAYQIIFKNWFATIDTSTLSLVTTLVGMGFGYMLALAVLGYVGYLYATRVLR